MVNLTTLDKLVSNLADHHVANPGPSRVLPVGELGIGLNRLCDECPLLLPVQVAAVEASDARLPPFTVSCIVLRCDHLYALSR